MDFNTLRYNLQQPYLQSNWQAWLQFIFGQQVSIDTKAEKILIQKGNAKIIERFASIALSDNRNIAVLDIVTTKDIQIARNRVALRDIVFNLIDQDKYHGLLVFYFSEDKKQADYRFSFISSQTEFDGEGNLIKQSTHPKRFSFILGSNETCTTATKRLLELKSKVPKFKAFENQKGISLKDVTDTFSVQALNDEFFKKYKEIHYKRFWEFIVNNDAYANLLLNKDEQDVSKQQKPIRDFVKKMFGRIVFLHFLQKKGWLGCPANTTEWIGGDKNFMQNLFTHFKKQETFYHKCLTALFYQTLNIKRDNDLAPTAVTTSPLERVRLPFLNGGLFDDDQPQTNDFNFPVEYFKDLFDFFEQYNFTIDENSPEEQEVGIDPEMLGHIFENLLEENKDKGAFYTPKEIVHYMCQESLIQYLRTHLPECTENESQATKAIEIFIRKDDIGNRNDKKNFVVANAKRIEAILDKVKICDPAIGSGAFPMGMLQEIFKAKTTLDLTLDKAQVKKYIIQNSIYGVDIEKGAVDIARLRFWLALVVDEDMPQPLPNLDYKIMQGNSLLESFEEVDLSTLLKDENDNEIIVANKQQIELQGFGIKQSLMVFEKKDKKELQQLINLYFDFDPKHVKVVQQKNQKNQKNQINHSSDNYSSKQQVKQAINTIVEGKLKAHFFIEKQKYESQKTEQIKLLAANKINPTDPKGIADKKQKNQDKLTKIIDELSYKITHLTDILHKLNQWETTDKERPYFLWHTYFKDVFDKGGFDIVIGNPPYGAKINDIATYKRLFPKTSNGQIDTYKYFFDKGICLLNLKGVLNYITSDSYIEKSYFYDLRTLITSKNLDVFNIKLGDNVFDDVNLPTAIVFIKYNDQKQLAYSDVSAYNKEAKINNISTNKRELFYSTNFTDKKSLFNNLNSKKLIELYDQVMGVKVYQVGKGKPMQTTYEFEQNQFVAKNKIDNLWLPFIEDGIKRYDLNQSIKFIKYGPWLAEPRDIKFFNQPKVLIREVVNPRVFACYVEQTNVVKNTAAIIIQKQKDFGLKFLVGLVNSLFFSHYIISQSPKRDNKTFPSLSSNLIKDFQIVIDNPNIRDQLTKIVDKILSLKATANDSTYYENKIDALVFHLYGLTEVEMNQVLDTFKTLDTKQRTQIQNEYKNISNNKFRLEV